MADREPPQTPKPSPNADKPTPSDGKEAQIDEAKDEGAGKKSVPIEDVTTANDK